MSSCWNEKITTKSSYRNHTSFKPQSNCAWVRWLTNVTTRLIQSLCNGVPTFSWLRRFRQGTIIGGHDHVATHIVGAGCDGNHNTKAQGGPGGKQLLPQACICESCEACNMSNFIDGFTYFWGWMATLLSPAHAFQRYCHRGPSQQMVEGNHDF